MEVRRLSRNVRRTLCVGSALAAVVVSSAGAAPLSSGGHGPAGAPGLSLTKTADNAEVGAGAQIGFEVTLANDGTGTATGVAVTDAHPAGSDVNWALDQANIDPGWTLTGEPPDQNLAYFAATFDPGVSSTSTSSARPPAFPVARTTTRRPSRATTAARETPPPPSRSAART
jgi:uncharacterized repeat protein (TIGR01451 family)